MTERDGANIYEDFREWIQARFQYERDTARPVTYRQLTKHFPRRQECSADVLATLLDELNGNTGPQLTRMTSGAIVSCYRHLTARPQ